MAISILNLAISPCRGRGLPGRGASRLERLDGYLQILLHAGFAEARALATVTDNGVPTGLYSEVVDNSDIGNTSSSGTWTAQTTPSGFWGYNYQADVKGTASADFIDCARNTATGNTFSGAYTRWVAAHGINTSANSTYTGGTWVGFVLQLGFGGLLGSEAAAGSEIAAEDAGTAAGREITTYYPPNRGFFGESTSQVLRAGTRIDRYGGEGGTFVSPEGTPVPMRALPPGATARAYNVHEVVNPIEVRRHGRLPRRRTLRAGSPRQR